MLSSAARLLGNAARTGLCAARQQSGVGSAGAAAEGILSLLPGAPLQTGAAIGGFPGCSFTTSSCSSSSSPPPPPTPQASAPDATPSTSASTPASASPSASPSASTSAPHISRRDKSTSSADPVYPSSLDDNLGVQSNWFNALFQQLNVVHRTGMAPHMKGRQKEIFNAVEREFEGLWERYIKGKGLQGTAHRGMLLCCLAVATHKVLRYESGDDELVKEVVRTNLGGMAVGIMMKLHKGRLWMLLRLLNEDAYNQAVRFLPTLQDDLGSLVAGDVAVGPSEATWTTRSCAFHSLLAAEGAPELLPEFCCQYSMQWLEEFAQYGVRVGLEKSYAFDDDCCLVRISRPGGAAAAPGDTGGAGKV